MKMKRIYSFTATMLATAGLLWPATPRAQGADAKTNPTTAAPVNVEKPPSPEEELAELAVKVATDEEENAKPAKDRAWLGVGVEEASEALSDQLGLDAGVGLVVTHVSEEGPAAQAGLKKHDVLVELAGQSLVHPAQLRKLVQARKAGDNVELVFYRSGKKQTGSATLEKAPARLGLFDEGIADENLRELHRRLLELPHSEALQARVKALHESVRQIPSVVRRGIDTELQHGLEQARQAIAQAARAVDRNKDSLRKESSRLKELLESGISVDDNATVVVRSKSQSARSIVKTDDWGTIIIVGPPKLHLTARAKSGKMLFEGDIETPEQRAKVPTDVWKRVEPLLDEKSDAR